MIVQAPVVQKSIHCICKQGNAMHKTLVHYHHLPLKTSLNSPGGACRMKSEAMATYKGPEYHINGVINDRSKI